MCVKKRSCVNSLVASERSSAIQITEYKFNKNILIHF